MPRKYGKWGTRSGASYGKSFKCKKGKHKGKLVRYKYHNGRKTMVRHYRRGR